MKYPIPTYFASLAFLSCLAPVTAHAEESDSLAIKELDEIVIEAPKVIHKADMDVYHPSQTAVDNAKNGIQLLSNLMIPSISVSDALGTISSAGQEVQVRINGREASVDQVRNLLPSTIKRVEWMENPGLRYSGANTVLNFIVVNPTVGGSLMVNTMQALTAAWGQYNPNLKLNFGRSQLEIGGGFKLTRDLKMYREYSEKFIFPEGKEISQSESPLGGEANNTQVNAYINYNYIKPDTTVVVVSARNFIMPNNSAKYYGLMSSSVRPEDVLLTDASGDRSNRPSLSAYWEQHFAREQLLVVDFKAQYYIGGSYSDYIEQYPDNGDYIQNIRTDIKDRNQVYAIEANYIKNWRNSKFTAGGSYTANRNKSIYENLGGEVFHQRQDKVYIFAEYFQRLNRFTLTAGVGAQYTDFFFRETGQGSHSWNLRPQAAVTYSINPKHQLRLNFESWQSTPSLAQTNPVPQQIDGFQWRVGNANLKTSNSYMLTLRYNFQIPRVYGQFGVRAYTSPNAITPLLMWEVERLITTYENSRGLQNISLFLAPQIEVVPDWLTISGYLQWRAERMRGSGYHLTSNAWSGHASLQLRHWGFTLSAQYMRSQRDLWGESISWGEDINLIDLTYNWKQWGFSVGCIMPFGAYDQGSISLSKIHPSERHTRMSFRLPYIGINYNLQWGHQKRNANKLINVSGDTDKSTAGGK